MKDLQWILDTAASAYEKRFMKKTRIFVDISSDPMDILFIKSNLRLVIDLQNCVKAQQSQAYARKVKLTNLQEMAKTIAYVQEHEYDTREILEDKFSSVKERTSNSRKQLNEYSCAMKSHFRKFGNQSSGTRKSPILCLMTYPFLFGYWSRPCRICGA